MLPTTRRRRETPSIPALPAKPATAFCAPVRCALQPVPGGVDSTMHARRPSSVNLDESEDAWYYVCSDDVISSSPRAWWCVPHAPSSPMPNSSASSAAVLQQDNEGRYILRSRSHRMDLVQVSAMSRLRSMPTSPAQSSMSLTPSLLRTSQEHALPPSRRVPDPRHHDRA